MSLNIVQNILELADPYRFISAGADYVVYDRVAAVIFGTINKNLTAEEIQQIIWNEMYNEFCVCKIADSKEDFILDYKNAVAILGTPERFLEIAKNIKSQLYNV